jgi:hypothetical protein
VDIIEMTTVESRWTAYIFPACVTEFDVQDSVASNDSVEGGLSS